MVVVPVRSSGVFAVSRDIDAVCSCGFEGEAVEVVDPEAHVHGWECPSCESWNDTEGAEA